MARTLDEDELIEHWLLIGKEPDLLTGRTGPSKLALALWLKFFAQHGRFPEGRSELPDEAVAFVAGQVKVPAAELGLFNFSAIATGTPFGRRTLARRLGGVRKTEKKHDIRRRVLGRSWLHWSASMVDAGG
ncbi:DUF4158 domain-containing protein [Nonomuraea africana]|uniref:DUF4158 domain-containing protein n=1 Tax=Nonomuraea africana TaxID=46171 RepID=UPI00340C4D8A